MWTLVVVAWYDPSGVLVMSSGFVNIKLVCCCFKWPSQAENGGTAVEILDYFGFGDCFIISRHFIQTLFFVLLN